MKNLSLLLKKPKTAFHILAFKAQLYIFNKITKGKKAWALFDKAGIAGFGTNLIRLYFPVYYDGKRSRESFSVDLKQRFSAFIEDQYKRHEHLNMAAINMVPEILKLPVQEADINKPYLDNYYFGIYDAASLAAIMRHFRPKKIVEIGSGISTRYMRLFKEQFTLETKIICIDPFPRAEINGVADELIKEPLEKVIENGILNIQSGDIAFLDGSHYLYQGNDTLTFFFKFLPSIPPGAIIHVHDIYLPFDYTDDVAPQLWTEQYLLAAMLMAGFEGYEILHPAYYLSQTNKTVIEGLNAANELLKNKGFSLRTDHTKGYSFWIRKTQPQAA